MSEPLIALREVSYSYPSGTEALAGLDLDVAAGEIVAVTGPSGCGKSTLLSLVAGLAHPTSGMLKWGSHDPDGRIARKLRRRLTLVFQKDTLLPWLTVEQNVSFPLRFLKLDQKTKRERVDQLLALGGLTDYRHFYPYRLSGGMRRRVAFLAGVAPMPALLLLDEPFSALDEPTRVGVHAEILPILRLYGIAVLLVTHDLGEAISLSDRVIVLSRRPAHPIAEIKIPFGKDRDLRTVRETEEYLDLYRTVWHALYAQSSEQMGHEPAKVGDRVDSAPAPPMGGTALTGPRIESPK